METFKDKVLQFYSNLSEPRKLPEGVHVLNPYTEKVVWDTVTSFYTKYFNDTKKRVFIFGINPGRLGAGATGVPFADTSVLEACGIETKVPKTTESSATFVADVISKYGGPESFYSDFFITNTCPFGFIKEGVNFNYYDDRACLQTLMPYIQKTLKQQKEFGAHCVGIVFGKGKNFQFIKKLNDSQMFFDTLVPLEHPHFIMQYRRRRVDEYQKAYLETFRDVLRG